MKRIRQKLEVLEDSQGLPRRVRYRGVWREVAEVLDLWYEMLPWWPEGDEEGGVEVAMARVLLEGGLLLEMERRPARGEKGSWRLYRLYD